MAGLYDRRSVGDSTTSSPLSPRSNSVTRRARRGRRKRSGHGLRYLDTDWTTGQVIGAAIDVHTIAGRGQVEAAAIRRGDLGRPRRRPGRRPRRVRTGPAAEHVFFVNNKYRICHVPACRPAAENDAAGRPHCLRCPLCLPFTHRIPGTAHEERMSSDPPDPSAASVSRC
jgi:hypothetical protein